MCLLPQMCGSRALVLSKAGQGQPCGVAADRCIESGWLMAGVSPEVHIGEVFAVAPTSSHVLVTHCNLHQPWKTCLPLSTIFFSLFHFSSYFLLQGPCIATYYWITFRGKLKILLSSVSPAPAVQMMQFMMRTSSQSINLSIRLAVFLNISFDHDLNTKISTVSIQSFHNNELKLYHLYKFVFLHYLIFYWKHLFPNLDYFCFKES